MNRNDEPNEMSWRIYPKCSGVDRKQRSGLNNKGLWIRAVILALLIVWIPNAAAVEKSYDRFDDITLIKAAKPPPIPGWPPALTWSAEYRGKNGHGAPSKLQFAVSPLVQSDWIYLRCDGLALLGDDEPVKVPHAIYNGRLLPRGGMIETFFVNLTPAIVLKLASANKVEMRVCRDEYTFDSEDMANLRDFAGFLKDAMQH